jgi:hypothetical protein
MTASAPDLRANHRSGLRAVPVLTGIGFAVSWIAGLSVPAPSPAINATGATIVSAHAGHTTALSIQYALTEGLPAAGLAVIAVLLARNARRPGGTAARLLRIAGITAALISVAELIIGLILDTATAPTTAHVLFATLNRMDGVKMLTLAAVGVAAACAGGLPRWLGVTGIALAVAITVSGVAFLLLARNANTFAAPALILLIVFVAGSGIALGRPKA